MHTTTASYGSHAHFTGPMHSMDTAGNGYVNASEEKKGAIPATAASSSSVYPLHPSISLHSPSSSTTATINTTIIPPPPHPHTYQQLSAAPMWSHPSSFFSSMMPPPLPYHQPQQQQQYHPSLHSHRSLLPMPSPTPTSSAQCVEVDMKSSTPSPSPSAQMSDFDGATVSAATAAAAAASMAAQQQFNFQLHQQRPQALLRNEYTHSQPLLPLPTATYSQLMTQQHQQLQQQQQQHLQQQMSRGSYSLQSISPTHLTHSASPQMNQLMQQQYSAATTASVSAAMMSISNSHAQLQHDLARQQQQQDQRQHQFAITPEFAAAAALLTPEQRAAKITALLHEGETFRARHQNVEALQRFVNVLFLDPRHVQALNFAGSCHKSLRQFNDAIECYQRALTIAPTDWISSNNLGIIYKEIDRYDLAIQHYATAISHGPPNCVARENMSVVKTDLGTRMKMTGDTNEAIRLYMEAIEFHAGYWPVYFNLGVVYSESGDYDRALQFYNRAVEKHPNYVEALCNIGVIHKNAGRLDLAIEYYQKALKANPNFLTAANNLAIALTDKGTQVKNEGKLAEGVQLYKQALYHNSKYPAAWYNLGVAYAEKHESDQSKLCYEMAVLFDPKCAEAYNNLGVIYKDRGNLEQAVTHYNNALKACPTFSQTLNNLGVIYTMLGKLDEAFDYCTRAIQANPNYAEAHNNLGVLYRDEGRIEDAIQSYSNCLKIDPLSRNAGQNRLLALNSVCRPHESEFDTLEYVWQAHRDWGTAFANLVYNERYTNWANTKFLSTTLQHTLPSRPLRIGYLSADFFTHSVSYFIQAPLQFADPKRTHVICYSNVARSDKKTQLLQSYAHAWRPIHDKSAKEVCELIRSDGIDILVELTGHTAGNRLDVMALKPAPIQVTWIGYPNTTGLPTIDYRFCDAIVDPPDTQQKYSEQLVRLPSPFAFLCYSPPIDAPAVSDTPALLRGYVTFGSFNNLAKINDQVLDTWCAILKQVPNSRMLIKTKPFASTTVASKMLAKFQEREIEASRIDLIPLLPTTSEHLATYSSVDISVDTFPYAGTTTTCESLFMGVPVVTLKREPINNHAHNVGATLIARIEGAESLIAHSMNEYIALAVSLASDIPRLQRMRQHLRPAMLKSTLCDGAAFVRSLEDVYHSLYHHYCNTSTNIAPTPSSSASS